MVPAMVEPVHPVIVRYRPMVMEDVEEVHRLDVQSFSLPWPERSFRYELTQNRNAMCWVAEAETADAHRVIAGMIVVWLIVDEVHIGTVAVNIDFRRLGIGRQLVARSLLSGAIKGARIGFLEVRRSNLAAQALYLQMGFEVVGERRRYYHDNNEDALLMTLNNLDQATLQSWIK
jgi:ribosomal-protein-alanine N-acetyltransferase